LEAGFTVKERKKLPKITINEADTIMIDQYFKEKEGKVDDIIVQMVCFRKRKKFVCEPIELKRPTK